MSRTYVSAADRDAVSVVRPDAPRDVSQPVVASTHPVLNIADRIAMLEAALDDSARQRDQLAGALENARLEVEIAKLRIADKEAERLALVDELREVRDTLAGFQVLDPEPHVHVLWNAKPGDLPYCVEQRFVREYGRFLVFADAIRCRREVQAAQPKREKTA